MNLNLLLATALMTCSSCSKSNNPVIPPSTNARNDLVIKSEIVTQSFVGNGVQWGGYDMLNSWTGSPTLSESDWNKLFLRVRFMRPPLVRIMVSSGWNYMVDNQFTPTKSENVLLKILDFCQKEGISVMFGEWGHREEQALIRHGLKTPQNLLNG